MYAPTSPALSQHTRTTDRVASGPVGVESRRASSTGRSTAGACGQGASTIDVPRVHRARLDRSAIVVVASWHGLRNGGAGHQRGQQHHARQRGSGVRTRHSVRAVHQEPAAVTTKANTNSNHEILQARRSKPS